MKTDAVHLDNDIATSLPMSLHLSASQELRATSEYLHSRFVHVRHVVAHAGVYVAGPAAAVEQARSASRPAANSGACVTAIYLLLLFASFWTFPVTPLARKITRCRVFVLCRGLHGAHASILQQRIKLWNYSSSLDRIFSEADAEETAV